MPSLKPFIVGNWKMNGLEVIVAELGRIIEGYDAELRAKADLAICPPLLLFFRASRSSRSARVSDRCTGLPHPARSGAHTGTFRPG